MEQGHVYLNNMLQQYHRQLEEQKQELKKMPKGHLNVRHDLKQPGYVWVRQRPDGSGGGSRYERKSITGRTQLVHQLARKKYLETSIRLLSEEIDRTNRFLKSSRPPTPDNVLELLPRAYKSLPEEMFFPARTAAGRWAAGAYKQNSLYLEEKIHTTGRGLKVRSKSELFIADKLDMYGLLFQYDAMIYFEDHAFSPDFTIPTTDGMRYWEHCGRMDEPHYRSRNKWKLTMYEKMGIVPWKNLIITYDSEDGGLNVGIIDAEIKNKLLPIKL